MPTEKLKVMSARASDIPCLFVRMKLAGNKPKRVAITGSRGTMMVPAYPFERGDSDTDSCSIRIPEALRDAIGIETGIRAQVVITTEPIAKKEGVILE